MRRRQGANDVGAAGALHLDDFARQIWKFTSYAVGLFGAGVGEQDAIERQDAPDGADMIGRLNAAADDPQSAGVGTCKTARGDRRRRRGAQTGDRSAIENRQRARRGRVVDNHHGHDRR